MELKTPWERLGMEREKYRDMPWKEKKKLLRKLGYKFSNIFQKVWRSFWIWKRTPPGSYLLSAWFKSEAERKHLEEKWTFAPWEK